VALPSVPDVSQPCSLRQRDVGDLRARLNATPPDIRTSCTAGLSDLLIGSDGTPRLRTGELGKKPAFEYLAVEVRSADSTGQAPST
jgi:hypothetical protein